jgi:phage terminase large subunit-like protein
MRRKNNRAAVDKYISRVLSGKQPAGRNEILAIERHIDDLKNAPSRGFDFSWDHADSVINFFPLLTHPNGAAAGEPFELVPAQKTFLAILHGWRRAETGLRRFREAFLSMARGNGKSPLAAGMALQLFTADIPFELGAEVVCAATTRQQAAKYVWKQAKAFITELPSLNDRLRLKRDTIEFPIGNSTGTFEPLGSDSNNLDGGNYHAAVIDELHAMREQHRELIEKINTSMGKREQDLLVKISTAGSDRSPLWIEEYDYANKVLAGVVTDDQYFAYIFETDDELEIDDRDGWRQSNPLLDRLSIDRFQQMCDKAKASKPHENEFRRYKLNQKVSSRAKAFSPELWKRGNATLSALDGCRCFAGLDMGWRNDLAALVLVFPIDGTIDEDDPITFYEILGFAWLPEETERETVREPFRSLISDGSIEITDGNTTDHRAIVRKIVELSKRYSLQTIAADPNNARAVLTELTDEGLEVFEFFQTCRNYNEPTNKLLDLLDSGLVRHGADPLLAWSADNVVLRTDSLGYVMPDKKKSSEKIDPTVALLMALSETMFGGPEPKPEPRIRAL